MTEYASDLKLFAAIRVGHARRGHSGALTLFEQTHLFDEPRVIRMSDGFRGLLARPRASASLGARR